MELATIGVEEWLNVHEREAICDIAQSSIASLTMSELLALDEADGRRLMDELSSARLDYGWIEGSPQFKEAVASLYRTVRPEHVLQMNGATGANLNALLALVGPGDYVVAEYPTYAPLYEIPRALGAQVSLWHLREDRGWQGDLEELRSLVRPETRLICLNNAANPLGTLLDRQALEEVVQIAESVGAYVLCDEVYLPLENEGSFVSAADLYERAVVTCSVSKTFSLPAARVGWTATRDAWLAERLAHYRDHTLICAGVPGDLLATYVLRHRDAVLARNREVVRDRRAVVQEWVDATPRASWVAPQGVSVSYLRLDLPEGLDDEEFCLRLLRERGVLLVPGSRFELPCGARLGYCCDREVLQRGLALVGEALDEL